MRSGQTGQCNYDIAGLNRSSRVGRNGVIYGARTHTRQSGNRYECGGPALHIPLAANTALRLDGKRLCRCTGRRVQRAAGWGYGKRTRRKSSGDRMILSHRQLACTSASAASTPSREVVARVRRGREGNDLSERVHRLIGCRDNRTVSGQPVKCVSRCRIGVDRGHPAMLRSL